MCHPSPENSHDSFSESTDWASVPVPHSPPQAVIFRVADRVAEWFAWQTAWRRCCLQTTPEQHCLRGTNDGQEATAEVKHSVATCHLIVPIESEPLHARCERSRYRG